MKANELRIGNWISAIYEHEIDRGDGIVEDVESSDVVQFIGYDPFENYIWTEGGFRDEYREFNPIPLTEEWLLSLGFISDPYQDMYIKGWFKLNCDKTRGKLNLWIENITGKILYIEHVHQLQNLYFALTGEELTINQ